MMMEIGGLVTANGGEELLEHYETVLMEEFQARPHWGLDLSVLEGFEQVERLYPKAGAWRAVFEKFNEHGTFDGPLTDRLDISMGQRDG
jgi:hypothetical protein